MSECRSPVKLLCIYQGWGIFYSFCALEMTKEQFPELINGLKLYCLSTTSITIVTDKNVRCTEK